MLDYILYFFAALIMLTGVISIIYYLFLYLLTPLRREPYIVLLSLRDDNNPISIVGAALEKRNLCRESKYCKIIGVDKGISRDTLIFLQDFYGTYDNFDICSASQLDFLLEEKFAEINKNSVSQ